MKIYFDIFNIILMVNNTLNSLVYFLLCKFLQSLSNIHFHMVLMNIYCLLNNIHQHILRMYL